MRRAWVQAIGIAVLILCVYLFMSSRTTLWDRDESWFARAAVEMVESGNYLVPTFNGEMWTDKPILYYWLLSAPVRLFGPTAFACRIWSAIGTAATCMLTFIVGKRLWGNDAGLWAMLILASSLMILGTGTLAIIDGTLLPIMTTAMVVFIHAVVSKPRLWHAPVMGCAFGLGMLAKGPIGLLPVGAMATTLFIARKTKLPIGRHIWSIVAALAIGAVIFLAWAIPVNSATHGEFFSRFIGREVFYRALHPMESHGGSLILYLPYYLIVIILGFFPWTLYLPGGLSVLFGDRLGGQWVRAIFIGWIVPIPAVMTFAATKLPHYILFIWPGLALLTAAVLVGAGREAWTRRDRLWLRRADWFFSVPAFGAAVGLAVGPWFLAIPGLRFSGFLCGAILFAILVAALRNQHAGELEPNATVLLGGMLILQIPLQFGVLRALDDVKVTPGIAAAVNAATDKEVPVASYKFGEPSLNFYIGRPIETLRNSQAVADWAQQAKPGVLIVPRDAFNEIIQHDVTLSLERIASQRGFNYSKGRPVEILALFRGGTFK
jgi:4-amino-4-deoxy-L-arabinose transferase-like glycosyltransferase